MKKILYTIIIILIATLLVLGGYIIIDHYIGKQENKENKENNKQDNKENIALNDERFYTLYNVLKNYTATKELNSKNLDPNTIKSIISTYLQDSDLEQGEAISNLPEEYYYNLKLDTFNKYLDSTFGSGSSQYYHPEDFITNDGIGQIAPNIKNKQGNLIAFESYNQNKQAFLLYLSGTGEPLFSPPKQETRKITEAILENDTITVKEKIIYVTCDYRNATEKLNCDIYSDPNSNHKIDHKEYIDYDLPENWENFEPILIDHYLNQATTITYTFKKNPETNQYYFLKNKIN